MPRPPQKPALILTALALTTLTGCYGTIAKRTADFATKAAPTITDTRNVYATVETTHARRKREEAIVLFDTEPYDKVSLQAKFGADRDYKARMVVLDLLQQYVDKLAEVSGDKPLADLGDAGKQAGDNLTALARDSLPALTAKKTAGSPATGAKLKSSSASAAMGGASAADAAKSAAAGDSADAGSSDAPGPAAQAIDALGAILVERRRAKALPNILQNADPAIQTLCALLESDIGTSPETGLRYVLRADYQGLEDLEDQAILDHAKDLSYPEKHAAVNALYTLITDQATADATLANVYRALESFAKAHKELAASAHDKRAPGFHAALAELIAEGRHLSMLENELGTPSGKDDAQSAAKSGGK